jgi:hypothetical protein
MRTRVSNFVVTGGFLLKKSPGDSLGVWEGKVGWFLL